MIRWHRQFYLVPDRDQFLFFCCPDSRLVHMEQFICVTNTHTHTLHHVGNYIMTSSNGNIFRVTGPLCGEFTGHRWIPLTKPVTRNFDVFFVLCLNKRLSKQPGGWWFDSSSRSFWHHCLCWVTHTKSPIKVHPYFWPVDQWIPLTNDQSCAKRFHGMASSW